MGGDFKFPERKIATPFDSDFLKGGQGSGNFGHSGRAGERGGSGSGDIVSAPTTRSGRNFTNTDKNVFEASKNTFDNAKVYEAVKNLPKGEHLTFKLEGLGKTIVIRHLIAGGYVGHVSTHGSSRPPQEFHGNDTDTESGVGHIINQARNRIIGT